MTDKTTTGLWHPMETAPHGRTIIVFNGIRQFAVHWDKDAYTGREAFMIDLLPNGDRLIVPNPTHWTECLPNPGMESDVK
jgi:hypothetical protein